MSRAEPNFDRLARIYGTLEYLFMGHALERVRFCFLPELVRAQRALVLGDGDGRFLSRLLADNDALHAIVVDSSAAMLERLRDRCAANVDRIQTMQADARTFVREAEGSFDLVVTHFFLDCFSQQEVDAMARSITAKLETGGLWVTSEFRIPSGAVGMFSWLLIRALYSAFGFLTGLETRRLPNHEAALRACGMVRRQQRFWWGGTLTAELWQKEE